LPRYSEYEASPTRASPWESGDCSNSGCRRRISSAVATHTIAMLANAGTGNGTTGTTSTASKAGRNSGAMRSPTRESRRSHSAASEPIASSHARVGSR
jgi:hypothetical protein